MAEFFYFKYDGLCKFMAHELQHNLEKYLREPNTVDGIRYYLNLEWNTTNKEQTRRVMQGLGARFVDNIRELPPGAGIYITAYDGNPHEVEVCRQQQIPLVEGVCPWLKVLKRRLLNPLEGYQYVFLTRDDHIVKKNYQCIFPEHTLCITLENFQERLQQALPGRPLYFLPYLTMRRSDFERICAYMDIHHPHPENRYDDATLCGWVVHQGILEELEQEIRERQLDQVWVICNTLRDTSTMSMIMQVQDCGAEAVVITSLAEIPVMEDAGVRIGCACAPFPFPLAGKIMEEIRRRYG